MSSSRKTTSSLDRFFSDQRAFVAKQNVSCAQKLIDQLNDPSVVNEITCHAQFNPHPQTHHDVEQDVEATRLALESWIQGHVDIAVPVRFLADLEYWIRKKEMK